MLSSVSETWLTRVAERYADQLLDSPVLSYLEDRGIDETTAVTFRLGWVSNPDPVHATYDGMLCIPYMTSAGGCKAVKFRRINEAPGPRYLAPQGQRSRLYNVMDLLHPSRYVIICEGELDTVTVSGVCNLVAVGVAGVTHWKQHMARALDGYEEVIILTDNDEKEDGANPGQDLAKRIMGDLPDARNVLLPPGIDANKFVVTHGRDALVELLGLEVE